MAKKRPEFNLPSTEKKKGAAAPATDWVYKSDAAAEPAAAKPVVKKPAVNEKAVEKPVVNTMVASVTTPANDSTATGTPQSIIKRYSQFAAAAGLIPMPFVDVVAISGLQVKMIQELADHYELEFNEQIVKGLIASLTMSGGATTLAYGAGRSMMKAIPVIGTIGALATMPAAAYGATWAMGELFAKHFASGGTLFNMKPTPAVA